MTHQDAPAADGAPQPASRYDQELRAFARDLRQLRIERGHPSLEVITERAKPPGALSKSSVSEVLNGRRLPSRDYLMALVRTLLAYDEEGKPRPVPRDDSDALAWSRRWQELALLKSEPRLSEQVGTSDRDLPNDQPATASARAHVVDPHSRDATCTEGDLEVTADIQQLRAENHRLVAQQELLEEGGLATYVLLKTLECGSRFALASLNGHTKRINAVAFSPDGQIVASASNDKTVRLWDLATQGQIGESFAGHTSWVNSVVFSLDGRVIASAGLDKTIRQWDPVTRKQVGPPIHTKHISAMALSPDGNVLASISGAMSALTLWDPRDHHQLSVFKKRPGESSGVMAIAFSPDSRLIATTGLKRSEVKLWDPAIQQQVGALSGRSHAYSLAQPVAFAINYRNYLEPRAVAFSPDGLLLATGNDDRTVRLWDRSTLKQIGKPLVGHTRMLNAVAFSPNGNVIASAGNDRTVRLWDPNTRQQIGPVLTGHTKRINAMAFSPDGRLLATASNDRTIKLWIIPPL